MIADTEEKLISLENNRLDFTDKDRAAYNFEITAAAINNNTIRPVFRHGYVKMAAKILLLIDITEIDISASIGLALSQCKSPKLIKKIIKILKPYFHIFVNSTYFSYEPFYRVLYQCQSLSSLSIKKYIIKNNINMQLYSRYLSYKEIYYYNTIFNKDKMYSCINAYSNFIREYNYIRGYQIKYKYIFLCKYLPKKN